MAAISLVKRALGETWGLSPPLSAMSTKIFQCYWKILNHQELSCISFFRCSLCSLHFPPIATFFELNSS